RRLFGVFARGLLSPDGSAPFHRPRLVPGWFLRDRQHLADPLRGELRRHLQGRQFLSRGRHVPRSVLRRLRPYQSRRIELVHFLRQPVTLSSIARIVLFVFAALAAPMAVARDALPRAVGRAFLDHGVPLNRVAIVVHEVGKPKPLFAYDAERPMNPASVMKLVTTFAALELLGRDYRWKTEAYLGGPMLDGALKGDLIVKGYGDPKITVEQWQAFMTMLRANGLDAIDGDLALDRSYFSLPAHDPAAFDAEPLKPYNVGPDPLLVNFKSVRLLFAPNETTGVVSIDTEPRLADVAVGSAPLLAGNDCGDWHSSVGARFVN